MLPFRCGKVPLLPKPPFQFVGLRFREQDSSLPLLVAGALLLVRFVLILILFRILQTGIAAVSDRSFGGYRSFRYRRTCAIGAQLLMVMRWSYTWNKKEKMFLAPISSNNNKSQENV